MLATEDCPCLKAETDIFSPRPRQVGMRSGTWMEFHPITTITSGGPIEFFVAGPSDAYLDLTQTMLCIRAKVVGSDGADLDHTNADAAKQDVISTSNLFLHSMFSDVSLALNEKQIEGGDHMYPYKAYLGTMCMYDDNVKNTVLLTQGYAKDEAAKFDNQSGSGWLTREKIIHGSRTFELVGPLQLDFFQQSRYLLNMVNMRLKLTPASPEFALMAHTAGKKYQIKISDATLWLRKVNIQPDLLMDNESRLKRQVALYPVQHSDMITYTIPDGSLSHTRDNLFRGLMPKFLLMGMTTNEAYNGKYDLNPFNFQHFNVSSVSLYREGELLTGQPLQPDFNKQLCMRDYLFFYQNLEQYNIGESSSIKFDDYIGGTTLFAFNLTPDLAMAGHAQPDREGNLRLELRFGSALAKAINVVLMAVFDGKVVFDQLRVPSTDFSI